MSCRFKELYEKMQQKCDLHCADYILRKKHHFDSMLLNKFQFCHDVIIPLLPWGYFLFGKHCLVSPGPYILYNIYVGLCNIF